MNRLEMEKKAIEIIKADMQHIGVSDAEILAEAKKLSDEELKKFIEE